MAQRLNNLINAVAESTGTLGAVSLSAIGCGAYAGVYWTYERSELSSVVSMAVLALSVVAILGIYLAAISKGATKEERSQSTSEMAPLMASVLNMGLLFSFAILLGLDPAIEYFRSHQEHFYIALGVAVSLASISIISAFAWTFAKMRGLASSKPIAQKQEIVETVEITETRVPTVSLRYSEKDRKRKAAHFAGRILCFAGSPYLDDDFDFEINEQFAQISYRADNTYETEDFLHWMVFQLLCAQQAEAAFAKKTSKVSWEHYGDIEYYVAEILASRPGASHILKDPQTAPELDWKAKRIRFYVKETVPRVHSFLRANQDQLRELVRSTLAGSLTSQELRSTLRSVDTAHLPGHWEEQANSRSHLTLVSS